MQIDTTNMDYTLHELQKYIWKFYTNTFILLYVKVQVFVTATSSTYIVCASFLTHMVNANLRTEEPVDLRTVDNGK